LTYDINSNGDNADQKALDTYIIGLFAEKQWSCPITYTCENKIHYKHEDKEATCNICYENKESVYMAVCGGGYTICISCFWQTASQYDARSNNFSCPHCTKPLKMVKSDSKAPAKKMPANLPSNSNPDYGHTEEEYDYNLEIALMESLMGIVIDHEKKEFEANNANVDEVNNNEDNNEEDDNAGVDEDNNDEVNNLFNEPELDEVN
jgi:hypothetical protein